MKGGYDLQGMLMVSLLTKRDELARVHGTINGTNLTNTTILADILEVDRSVVFEHQKELFGLGSVVVMIGLAVKLYRLVVKWYLERKHKNQIYKWLYDKTKHLEPFTVGSPYLTYFWPSTEEISSALDLTEERAKYTCTIHNKIQRQEKGDLWHNQTLEERWAVRKFVRE